MLSIIFLAAAVMAATNEPPVKLSFDVLKSWTYIEVDKTPIPESITKLDGKRVELVAYMMPLTELENAKEFLLVPYTWGCCYGEPPAVNHMIIGRMSNGKGAKFSSDQVKVRGVFRCGEIREDDFLVGLYRIEIEEIGKP